MDKNSLIDPELVAVLEAMPDFIVSEDNLEQLRAMASELAEFHDPPLEGVSRREVQVPGTNGQPDIRALIYRPADTDKRMPVILYLHGGGLVLNVPEGSDERNSEIAGTLGVMIIAIAYRLAPENPYPAQVIDSEAALDWIFQESESLGIDPDKVIVSGDSAGGCIALSLALRERDKGRKRIRHLQLLYPMLDDRTTHSDTAQNEYVIEAMWKRKSNSFGWRAYLGDRAPDPRSVPGREEDLSGLPSVWIGVGSLDLFAQENLQLAGRLIAAGVPCELNIYPGAFHGFPMAKQAAVTRRMNSDYENALMRAMEVK